MLFRSVSQSRYFANTQEDKFYIITGNTNASVTIDQQNQTKTTVQVGTDTEVVWQEPMSDVAILTAGDNVKDYASFWKSVKIRFYNPTNGMSKESYINYLTSNSTTKKSPPTRYQQYFQAEIH